MAVAAGGLIADAQPTEAAQKKVVIVVGPTGSVTKHYKQLGNEFAKAARKKGMKVVKVYSPKATWAKVKAAAKGANLFVYLGHGNGWPSPYGPFQTKTKNGLGLNKAANKGNNNVKYFGEKKLANQLKLAKNSVVVLMRLCYASGNSEPGRAKPSLSVAKKRADNYANGFLRAGARAVFAEGVTKSNYVINRLFNSNKTMRQIFWSSPNATRKHATYYDGARTPSWARAQLDPSKPGNYYRSVVGDLSMKAGAWR